MSPTQLHLLLVTPPGCEGEIPERLAKLTPKPRVTVISPDYVQTALHTEPVHAVLACVGRRGLDLKEVKALHGCVGHRPLLALTHCQKEGVPFAMASLSGRDCPEAASAQLLAEYLTGGSDTKDETDATAAEKTPGRQLLISEIMLAIDRALVLVDEQMRIVEGNAEFGRMAGIAPEQLAGLQLEIFLAPDLIELLHGAASSGTIELENVEIATNPQDPLHIQGATLPWGKTKRVWLLCVEPQASREEGGHRYAIPEAASVAMAQMAGRVRQQGLQLGAARVRIVGLDDVRRAAGAKWPRMRSTVLTMAASVVERHLGELSVNVPIGDGDLLICFPTADDEKANEAAEAIRRELLLRLMGDSLDEEKADSNEPSVAQMEIAVDAVAVPPEAVEDGPDHIEDVILKRLDDQHRNLDLEVETLLTDLRRDLNVDLLMVANRAGGAVPMLRMAPKDGSFSRLSYLTSALGRGEDLALALDTTLIERVSDAYASGSIPTHYRTLVDVHFSTLERRRLRETYVGLLHKLTRVASQQLVLNLVDLPASFYIGRLADALVHLRGTTLAQSVQLTAQQAATLNLTSVPCHLYVLTAEAAKTAAERGLGSKIREVLHWAKARLLLEHGVDAKTIKVLEPDLFVTDQAPRFRSPNASKSVPPPAVYARGDR